MSRLMILTTMSLIFSAAERKKANRKLNRSSAKICREKHDPQKRKSFPLKRWD
jgi:hypothetical protein